MMESEGRENGGEWELTVNSMGGEGGGSNSSIKAAQQLKWMMKGGALGKVSFEPEVETVKENMSANYSNNIPTIQSEAEAVVRASANNSNNNNIPIQSESEAMRASANNSNIPIAAAQQQRWMSTSASTDLKQNQNNRVRPRISMMW